MASRIGRALLGLVLATGPALVSVPQATAMPVVAVAAPTDNGLRYESHSTFTVDLAATAVHVQVAITVTNQQASQTSGSFVRQFYFPRVGVPVLSEATHFSATKSDGSALDVQVDDTEDARIKIAAVDLRPDLYYQQTQSLEFDYDLPTQPPRSVGITRVNSAFASFIAFGHGDSGITSVQIKVPASLDSEIVGADMKRETQGDQTVFTADNLDDPDSWTAAVSARDDSRLVQREDTVDTRTILVKAWPDDPQWADFVEQQLRVGLPTLKELVGQPWPDESKPLSVIETVAPYLYGYAGWFNPLDNTIEVGDALEPIVILHELSHTWFNRDLFRDRWVNEAFANEFAARAIEKAGQPLQSPDLVAADSPGAFRLNEWGTPKFQDATTSDQERFGYNASWTILRQLDDEIGINGLEKVIDAAAHHRIAYQGAVPAEEIPGAADWRRLLDLLEEVGGSKQAEQLMSQYAVSLSDASTIAERDKVRAAYHRFVDGSAGWGAPLTIRRALAAWNFDRVSELLPRAEDVLHTRDQIATTLQPIGLPVPEGLEAHYASADAADLEAITDETNRDLDAARHLVDADHAVHAGHNVIAQLGLLFGGADDNLANAKTALARSDPNATIASADRARAIVNGATTAGLLRILFVLLTLAAYCALLAWLAARRIAALQFGRRPLLRRE